MKPIEIFYLPGCPYCVKAKKAAAAKITELQEQISTCIQALERIKEANRPISAYSSANSTTGAFDFDRSEGHTTGSSAADAVADEISANLQNLVGVPDEEAPKAEPKHPVNDTTTGKFANLQFGRNYDPTHR